MKGNDNMKKMIKLTEGDLHRIVKASVKRVLNEDEEFDMTPIQKLGQLLTNLDEHTAESMANEIDHAMTLGSSFEEMVEHLGEMFDSEPYGYDFNSDM